jgi:hypothetical protein
VVQIKKVWFSISLLLTTLSVQANDSTLLMQRIEKIEVLIKELKMLPLPRIKEASDTINLIETYKEIEPRFFIPPFTVPEFNIRYALGYLHHMVCDLEIDSIKLRYPDPKLDSVVNVSGLLGYLKNTVIVYYHMYGADYEMFYFSFKEGSDQLIYLIEAGGEPEWYSRKKHFMDKLYALKKDLNYP